MHIPPAPPRPSRLNGLSGMVRGQMSSGPKSSRWSKGNYRRLKRSRILKKKPPLVHRSLEREYQHHFNCYILPFMSRLELNAVTVHTLENFRLNLIEEHELSVKTARNVIDGSLRAMLRDAGRRFDRNLFDELPEKWWPRLPRKSLIRSLKISATPFSNSTGQATRTMLSFTSRTQKRTKTRSKPKPYRVRGLTTREHWWSQRDSNPCYRRERPVS